MEWKVIYTGSRQEKKLAARLSGSGVEVYLPLYRKLSQWSDRRKWVELPLFPGYLFVRPTAKQREGVLQQPGAIAYLRFNGKDALVRQEEVDIIERILESGYSLEAVAQPPELHSGDRALVQDGPLKGQVVDVIRRNREAEYLVSFETLGQGIKISLPAHVLKPIES